MARRLSVPGFDFLGAFYYPQILELLIRELRANVPEITNESRGELAIQLLSAYALTGHLNAVLVDVTAHEALMVTSQLRDSLVAHLKLIGFEVPGDIPSTTDLVFRLSKTFTSTQEVIPALAQFQTRRLAEEDPIVFEVDAAVSVTRTDQVTKVWVYDASGPTYTDRTTEANNTGSGTFQALPATPAAGDALYVGHDSAMTDRIRVDGVSVALAGVTGLWEYSDTELLDEFPDSVTNLGSSLKLLVDSLLDTSGTISHAGLSVTVTLNSTGATETATVQHDGSNNYVTVGFLGQVSPSVDIRSYSVGTQWHRVEDLNDQTDNGTGSLQKAGDIDFLLPQTATRNWSKVEVNGVTAFWVRFRVVSVSTPTAPTIDRIKWDQRNTYLIASSTQGQTVTAEVLGSSDGTADQTFTLDQSNVIDGSVEVSVDSQTWTEVADFLSSTSVDEHYTVEVDSDGIATVSFGDGVNGKMPPSGTNNVTATYRWGADGDGNVGTETIIVNRSGVAFVANVFNPRPALGWTRRRGDDADDRERLKVEGPASLRVLERAVTGPDIEYLTANFRNAAGLKPFVRAKAIEEGFGAKTVKVVTVGPAGAATTPANRTELEESFNGDTTTGESGNVMTNQRVFARDYVQHSIDVTVIVTGTAEQEAIENAIRGLLSPVAVADDGINWRWKFAQTVTLSSIIAAILKVPGVGDEPDGDVNLTAPAANVTLAADELPIYGTISVTVVAP